MIETASNRETVPSLFEDGFLAGVNRDMRTPLSGIVGLLDLLNETQLHTDQQEFVESARVCAQDLLRQLNSALEFSALAAGRLSLNCSEFNVPECIRSVTAMYEKEAQSKGLEFSIRLDTGLPDAAIGDAARIAEVLSELLSNAVTRTAGGGIALRAGASGRREGRFRLTLEVNDTGTGISDAGRSTILESFRRVEAGRGGGYEGVGLGLALVHQLVRLMRGRIAIENNARGGTTFRVTIPLRHARPDRSATGNASRESPAP